MNLEDVEPQCYPSFIKKQSNRNPLNKQRQANVTHFVQKVKNREKKKKPAKSKNTKTCDLGKIKASRWTINSKELVQEKVRENKNCKERTTKKSPQQRTNW